MSQPTDSPGPDPAPDPPAPPIVLATAILLYTGAATGVVLSLVAGPSWQSGPMRVPSTWIAGYYALHAGLAYALQRRKRWARVTLMVLCLIGLAISIGVAIDGDKATALSRAAGPITYLILTNTGSARAWFRRPPAPAT